MLEIDAALYMGEVNEISELTVRDRQGAALDFAAWWGDRKCSVGLYCCSGRSRGDCVNLS